MEMKVHKKVKHVYRNLIKPIMFSLRTHKSLEALLHDHFKEWSSLDHQNRTGFEIALKNLAVENPIIFETGTSAYGVDSSRLFNEYVKKFGGRFFSVDINPKASKRLLLGRSHRTTYLISDSVEAIASLSSKYSITKIDFVYLDSWDVDWNDPLPAATHGLAEFKAISKYLLPGSIVLIDDTPNAIEWIPTSSRIQAIKFRETFGSLPGKGALVFNTPNFNHEYEILYHSYNLVLRKK